MRRRNLTIKKDTGKMKPRVNHRKTLVMERFRREPIPDLPKKIVRPKAEYSNPQWNDLVDKLLND